MLPDDIEQKIIASVFQDQMLKEMPAPKVTQDEAKMAMSDMSGMPMNSPVPEDAMGRMQKEKDKSYQKVVAEYMKKKEQLAKNAEERAKIVGAGFQQQMDLTPLMNFIDNMHGSNISAGYKRPETLSENLQKQQQFENVAAQQYGALADDQMNMLRQALLRDQYMAKRESNIADRELKKDVIQAKKLDKGDKPLSGELLKRLDYTIDGQNALNRLYDAVEAGETMRPDIPFVGDNTFTEALRDAAENYGRMQSGGAINKAEEARFIKTVWKMGDTREDVKRKIEKQMEMFKGREQRIKSGGRDSGYKMSEKEAAMEWLQNNPDDPRAEAVRAKLEGM